MTENTIEGQTAASGQTWQWILFLAVVLLATPLDWWSKGAAVDYHVRECGLLAERTGIPVFDLGFLNLHLVREYNTGMAFGLLQDVANAPIYLAIIRGIATLVLTWLFFRITRKSWLHALAFGSLVAGAAGNLLDNLFHRELGHEHSVRDFILLSFGDWRVPAFNVADVFVSLGALLLLVVALRPR